MFACLYSLSAPQALLITVAQDFTPRFECIGPLVMLDLSGLSRLFGSPREIGEQLRRSMAGAPVRIAIASSQTAAALLALGRPGLTVAVGDEQPAAIAQLPVSVLGELETLRRNAPSIPLASMAPPIPQIPPAPFEDVLPYFQSQLDRTSAIASKPHSNCGGGWTLPRDSHAAKLTRRIRRGVTATKDAEHPHTATGAQRAALSARTKAALKDVQLLLDVLRRWGIKTLGALAALPAGDVYERLGAKGVSWQRLSRGEDQGPLVPCVPEEPFEGTLELEWPIEGLEPLSFVLARLFEPLSERLERADRGAAILHTHLRLTTRDVYARTVQLPAPMRDPKTLRTLVLLDLESNPPSAGIDRVRVLVEPTPAKVLQWTLYERAQPSPEQVSTLVARLTALMGDGHVGSPALVDSWKPGVFEMTPFQIREQGSAITDQAAGNDGSRTCATALRRFRLPIPARVQMHDGRPVRIMVDRRGVAGGAVEQSAGPWRTSGEWWNDATGFPEPATSERAPQVLPPNHAWDRDEWDVLVAGGAAYRIFVERGVGQWFIEGVID